MSGVGVERGQREDRGLVARENFMEKVELDTNMHLWEEGPLSFLPPPRLWEEQAQGLGVEEAASLLET